MASSTQTAAKPLTQTDPEFAQPDHPLESAHSSQRSPHGITKALILAKTCAKARGFIKQRPNLKGLERNITGLWQYSDILNHPFVRLDRGFIFIHVPKTAGTSVREALGLTSALAVPQGHASARDVVPFARLVDPRIISMAFVRNPYARFLSLYNYARQDESLYHSVHHPDNAPYGKHNDYDILSNKSLEECAELLIQGKLGGHGVGLKLWEPQVEWLIDRRGKLIVDFIGRVESLATDLKTLKKRYGISSGPLPWRNKSIPKGEPPRFSSHARELVRLYYKRDFEMLGYDEESAA